MTAPPEISKSASSAGVPNAASSSPSAVWSAAGSTATASSPSSSGVNVSDAAIAADRHLGRRRAVLADDRDRRGDRRPDRLLQHPLRLGAVHAHRRDLDRQLDRRLRVPTGGQRLGDRVGGALPVQRPPVGGVHHARRGALEGDRGVHRCAVDLRGDGLELGRQRGLVAGDDRRDLALVEERDEPGPGVERLVVGGVDGAVDVEREPGGGGGEGRLHVVGDDGAVGGDHRCRARSPAVVAAAAGTARRCPRRRRRWTAGCCPARRRGRCRRRRRGRRRRRPGRARHGVATRGRAGPAGAGRRRAGGGPRGRCPCPPRSRSGACRGGDRRRLGQVELLGAEVVLARVGVRGAVGSGPGGGPVGSGQDDGRLRRVLGGAVVRRGRRHAARGRRGAGRCGDHARGPGGLRRAELPVTGHRAGVVGLDARSGAGAGRSASTAGAATCLPRPGRPRRADRASAVPRRRPSSAGAPSSAGGTVLGGERTAASSGTTRSSSGAAGGASDGRSASMTGARVVPAECRAPSSGGLPAGASPRNRTVSSGGGWVLGHGGDPPVAVDRGSPEMTEPPARRPHEAERRTRRRRRVRRSSRARRYRLAQG